MVLGTFLITVGFSYGQHDFKAGDLLFQDLDCGPTCDAIEAVTDGYQGYDFSHIGVVFPDSNGKLGVYEAIGSGVVITTLTDFLARSEGRHKLPKVMVGRLKQDYKDSLEPALTFLRSKLGAEYDKVYDLGNDSYYCSELVYLAFRHPKNNHPIFKTAPMTFQAPNSNEFFPVWIDYFNKLGVDIPEGQPGINPAGISKSVYLDLTFPYGHPDSW